MGLSQVKFFHFRNLEDAEIFLEEAKEIFLIGENGQGKTNFLEAVYLLCYGTSFRTKTDNSLVKSGFQDFSVLGHFSRADRQEAVSVKLEGREKSLTWNNQPVTDRKELVRAFPCVIFTHEDYIFVQGSPEQQRFFFDQTLSLYSILYLDTLRQYKKILRNRNFLLTTDGNQSTLNIWEEQLAQAGLKLMADRQALINEFNEYLPALFSRVSGSEESCLINYQPSWKVSELAHVVTILAESRRQEREQGHTTTGPHRDRYVFKIGGKNFATQASTGQIRLLSLCLRTAQANFAEAKTGKKPILLLDDVLLELDSLRRARFLKELPATDQTIFTFLPDENLGTYQPNNVLRLSVVDGRFFKNGN